jgi:hypothetical protein
MGTERVFAAWVPGIIDGTYPDGVGLYRATSASKARYMCYLAATDASFEVKVTDVRVRRAPEYDRAVFKNGVMPRYVEATNG